MPLVKPAAPPGFLSQATQAQARGGWYAGNLVRWRTGLLEKMGGWRRLIADAFSGTIRRLHAWLDLDNRKNLLIACDDGLHIAVQNTLYPLGRQFAVPGGFIPVFGAISDSAKFSVVLGSTEVSVAAAVNIAVGATFVIRLPVSIGGRIIPAGTAFQVKSLTPTGFTFDMPMPALAAETNTYGIPLLTNDIVNGMTVTWKAHGMNVGSALRIPQTTTIRLGAPGVWAQLNFSAATGTVGTVTSVLDADRFTIAMGPFGTGDGLGGTSHQVYLGSTIEQPTGGAVTATIGTVIGVVVLDIPLINPQRQSWFLANLGQDGLALATSGPLQVYKPPIQNGPFLAAVGTGPPATTPQKSNGMLVAMPQAQVILWGTEAILGSGVIDPLLIRFSNVGTYDEYTATVSNQAGSYRLSRGSRIMGALQAPQATLILTDTDLWQMSYIGPPLIYGFTIMGSGCGLVAPHAIGTLGRTTIWQGVKNFWQFDTGVQPVACTVWDYIFEDLDTTNINKCHAAPNSTTNELAFYFPSKQIPKGATVDVNVLPFSQIFGRWVQDNVTSARASVFKSLYVYEPQNVNIGWFDDSGIPPISWFDQDVQGELVKISGEVIFAPDGTDTASKLTEIATDSTHSISQKIDKVAERVTYTYSVYAHDSSERNLTLRAVTDLGSAYATFNVALGGVVTEGVTSPRFTLVSARVVIDQLGNGRPGNGWRRYVMTFSTDDNDTLELFFNLTKGTELGYLGEPPKGVMLWGAQLAVGNDPQDYQETHGVPRQNETRHYVKVNLAEGMAWDSGTLGRSAWLDVSVWGTPLGADTTPTNFVPDMPLFPGKDAIPRNVIQQHEIGYDDDGEPMLGVFVETGYTELGDGTAMMLIDQCHPDMKWFGRDGGVQVSLRAANYPQGPQHLYGPYSITPTTQWFNPRVRARYVAVRYDWEPRLGYSARVGATTFHVKPAGRLP